MSRFLNQCYQDMEAYTPGEQPRIQGLIKLNTNESPYPPSPRAVEAVNKQALENTRLYCDIGANALHQAIARRMGVEKDWVIAGNGSDEILFWTFLAYGEKGAAFADVTYGFYQVWAKLLGLDTRIVPLKEDFSIDPADYMTNDRMVVLANPNAPTGMVMEREQVERIIQANPDQIVVVDEAYVDFGGRSCVELTRKYDNLIVSQTCSKSRSLAGARLGYAVACPKLIQDLNKMKFSLNPYNVNSMTQLMGTASMGDEEYFRECVDKIKASRDWTAVELKKLGFTVLPSCTNFIFASPPDGQGSWYQQKLREENILVRHFNEGRIAPFVRISIGSRQQMERLVQVTKEVYR